MSSRRPRSLWGKERLAFIKFSDKTILNIIPLFEDCIGKEIALKLTKGCQSCVLSDNIDSPYFECELMQSIAGRKNSIQPPDRCKVVFENESIDQRFSFDESPYSQYFTLFLEELTLFVQIELARHAIANHKIDNLLVEAFKEEPRLSVRIDDEEMICDIVNFINGETIAFEMEKVQKMLFANKIPPTLREMRDCNTEFLAKNITISKYFSEEIKKTLNMRAVGPFGGCNTYRSPLMW